MIQEDNSVFHLFTEHYSYLLKINQYGIPEHLYFGPPVQTADADALSPRPGLGWGSSILLDRKDPASCLDALALEWSGSGRGDYREAPLELLGQPTDFRFAESRIIEGSEPMVCCLPQAHDGSQTLKLTFTQPGARLTLSYTLFPTALVRRTVLENTGDGPLHLSKCMSFCLDLPGSYNLTSFHGGWITEMGRRNTPVQEAKVVCESRTGASSNRCNPGFLLSVPGANEEWGRVYGFNLLYSGNHYASAQRSLQGLTRVMQGVNPADFCRELAPGECFETPEAVLCVSDRGFGGLSQAMHRFVTDHVIPRYWKNRPRPVLFNSWEGCMFDFNQRRLMDLAGKAKDLGCELFVLDDGWFGSRNDDRAGLGDYTVNTKKLPCGISGIARKIKELGMEFGLWFEPESVNVEIKEIQAQIAFYKAYRLVFQFGRFTRTETGWQVSNGKTTIAGVFHTMVSAAPGYEWLRVPNLEKNTRYQVVSLSQSIRIGQFGGLLKHVTAIPINPNGQILRIADHHITLPEAEEVLTVSGTALASGVPMSPLFRGTGYKKTQRNQGDFGSTIYIITEC